MSNEVTKMSVEEAKQAIVNARQERVQECGRELASLLDKYGCSLVSRQELINGIARGPAEIIIVANE